MNMTGTLRGRIGYFS